jgi:NDP-sugar pyrophosphorylase family protein
MRWLVSSGVSDLVLNLHHLAHTITAVVGDGSDVGARVRYSWESPVLGSAGGPRHALPLLVDGHAEELFVLVNGDTLTDFDLPAMIDAHRRSGALVSMALIPNPRPDVYGGVLVENGRVTGFGRPGAAHGDRSFHFIGVQVASAAAFADLPDGVPAESVMQRYPELLAEDPAAVAAHVVAAPFHDIGTPADYLRTSLELAAVEGDHLVSPEAVVAPSARLTRTAVWPGARIGDHAVLDACVVCDGVTVPGGSRYHRAAIAVFGGEPLQRGERVEGSLVLRDLGGEF